MARSRISSAKSSLHVRWKILTCTVITMSLSERFQSIRSNPPPERSERSERRSVYVQASPSNARQSNRRNVASEDYRGGRNNATYEGGIQKSRGARQQQSPGGNRDRGDRGNQRTQQKHNAKNGRNNKATGKFNKDKKKPLAGKQQKSTSCLCPRLDISRLALSFRYLD